jgi:hypothetical protein
MNGALPETNTGQARKVMSATTMTGQSCATCKFGKFKMTNHRTPRPKDQSGTCLYPPIELPKLPECVISGDKFKFVDQALAYRLTWPKDGTQCPVWEGKD